MLEKIGKLFSGEITEGEKVQLDEWTKSEENLNSFQRLKKLWSLMGNYKNDYQPDYEKGLENFLSRLRKDQTIGYSVGVIQLKKITYWAAACVIFLVSTLLVWNTYKNIGMVEYYTQAGQSTTIYLPDSSCIVMNENSEISYIRDFPERKVSIKGEAFFDIVRDTLKPFSVEGEYSMVSVLGTSFNVRTSKENRTDQVQVISGKVAFADKNKEDVRVILEKGYMAELKNHNITENTIQDYNFLFYKTGELTFSNTPLYELTETLEKFYHCDIEILSSEIKEVKVTTSFKNMSLEDIMNELGIILNISAQKVNSSWQLKTIE